MQRTHHSPIDHLPGQFWYVFLIIIIKYFISIMFRNLAIGNKLYEIQNAFLSKQNLYENWLKTE